MENMMALPPAQGVTRCVFNYTSQGVVTANVLHFTAPPGPDAPDPAGLASDLAGWWTANISSLSHTSHILQNVTCTDLSPSGPPAVIHTTGLPSAGIGTGDPMPNNAALVMSEHTALRGRSYRGRIYVGGIPETNSLGNTVLPAFRDAHVTRWNQLVTFVTAPFTPDACLVVLSYFNAGAQRATPVATRVTNITANTTIDTMRQRMR